jgi:hypothetical protein
MNLEISDRGWFSVAPNAPKGGKRIVSGKNYVVSLIYIHTYIYIYIYIYICAYSDRSCLLSLSTISRFVSSSGNAQMPSLSLHNYKVDLKSRGCLYFHVIIKLSSSPKRHTIHFTGSYFNLWRLRHLARNCDIECRVCLTLTAKD